MKLYYLPTVNYYYFILQTDSYVTRNKDDLFSDKYLFDTPCILPINLDHTNPDQVMPLLQYIYAYDFQLI